MTENKQWKMFYLKRLIFSIFHYPIYFYMVQPEETTNTPDFTDVSRAPSSGRILALDLGMKRIGVAVSDELQFTVRPVCVIERAGWKKVLKQVVSLLAEFDAVALVLGLPYNTDGSESEMSREARRLAGNFSLSVAVPVFLQDERVTSYDATGYLRKIGVKEQEIRKRVDSQAAAMILSDFIEHKNQFNGKRTMDNG